MKPKIGGVVMRKVFVVIFVLAFACWYFTGCAPAPAPEPPFVIDNVVRAGVNAHAGEVYEYGYHGDGGWRTGSFVSRERYCVGDTVTIVLVGKGRRVHDSI